MSCYAISRKEEKWSTTIVLVFPNRLLRSTFLEYTEERRGLYEECSAKEAYKHLSRRENVLHMSIPEYWDDKPFNVALERGLGHLFE